MIEDCTAIVMAGGDSRRMGQDKADLVFDGETLLRRAIATMQAIFPKVIVSVRQVRAGLDVPQVCDELPASGPLAGLISGLAQAGTSWVFAVACDMPFRQHRPSRNLRFTDRASGVVRWWAGIRSRWQRLCDERSGCDACGFCARRQKPA